LFPTEYIIVRTHLVDLAINLCLSCYQRYHERYYVMQLN